MSFYAADNQRNGQCHEQERNTHCGDHHIIRNSDEGDIFTLNVMGQTITYMVDQIRIVLPEETKDLAIQPGRDYCTLVTCTPYGVNTHRMLVRGKRIENIAGEVVVVAEAVRIPQFCTGQSPMTG